MSERPTIAILCSMLEHHRKLLAGLDRELEAIESTLNATIKERDSQAVMIADLESAIEEVVRANEPITA